MAGAERGGDTDRAALLASLPLFAGCQPDDLAGVAAALVPRRLAEGEHLLREGEAATSFGLLVEGRVVVVRTGPAGPERLAEAGPGSVLGELALLRGGARGATVTALAPSTALVGGAEAFAALLELPAVRARLRDLAARRLAVDVRPVPSALRDGTEVVVRPLLPGDRAQFVADLASLSPETLRRRFFTVVAPSPRLVDHLIELDYVDHFAWAVLTARSLDGVGVGRYVRSREDPAEADVAVTVRDQYQGRGAGRLLLGAAGVAARAAGVERFTAELLADNAAMRTLLARASATFSRLEPAVLGARLAVADAEALLDAALCDRLRAAPRDVVTAAGLALASDPPA